MNNLRYYNNCVNWIRSDVHAKGGLCDMIDGARHITRRTFCNHVDRESLSEVERALGYTMHVKDGLTMANDNTVSYHKSKLHGRPAYFFTHSAIEFVFTLQED